MAAIDYDNLATKIRTTIRENGRLFTLISKKNVPDDPAKPWKTATPNDEATSLTGVFGSYTSNEIDDTIVKRGDKKILIDAENEAVAAAGFLEGWSALSLVPTLAGGQFVIVVDDVDQIIDGDDKWDVVSVKRVRPAGRDLLYIFQVRL